MVPALVREAAAGRIGPVAPRCTGKAQTAVVDDNGDEDRCVSRSAPLCEAGATLKPDVEKTEDRCVSGEADVKGQKPTCPQGLKLVARSGEDLCELVEKVQCPSGFSLKKRKGTDICQP